MRRIVVAAAAIVMLVVVNWTVASREALLAHGRTLLLALAPVDPRSLMQGDYMALRFALAERARAAARHGEDGFIVVRDANGVAEFRRLDDGTPLAADELRLRYRWRNGQLQFGTNAFFFEEGHASDFAKARYGEFRVSPDGDMLLTGLRDTSRAPLDLR